MTTLPLETCKLAKAAGFDQEQSHHRWYWWSESSFMHGLQPELSCPGSFGSGIWYKGTSPDSPRYEVEWCAAPDPLALLEWIAKEHGWVANLLIQEPYREGNIWAHGPDGGGELFADTAADLALAILRRLTEGT